jgi:hypothetical protein
MSTLRGPLVAAEDQEIRRAVLEVASRRNSAARKTPVAGCAIARETFVPASRWSASVASRSAKAAAAVAAAVSFRVRTNHRTRAVV